MKILFFIESLRSGGKERRLLELIHYLNENTDYTLAIVITERVINYEYVNALKVSIKVLERRGLKKDPALFGKFFKFCNEFKPDIIHTWGFMNTFYAIPAKLILRTPMISSMISVAHMEFKRYSLGNMFFRLGCLCSNSIVSNSYAGLHAFGVKNEKGHVIYNGVRLERFSQSCDTMEVREQLGIKTKYVVIMVASFSRFKDYDLFLDAAIKVNGLRNDVTFVAVGSGPEWDHINNRVKNERIRDVILTGQRHDIEKLIAASDLGLLCTFSEGISNSIIEYMALGKPVVVTDTDGGSKELVIDGKTGYCVERNPDIVSEIILRLFDQEQLRFRLGKNGFERIKNHFSVERMGREFVALYNCLNDN